MNQEESLRIAGIIYRATTHYNNVLPSMKNEDMYMLVGMHPGELEKLLKSPEEFILKTQKELRE